jgi:hypothetical protein
LTPYTATITTGAKDTNGNALASNFNWTFSTADVVPPTVLTVSPANNATNVPTNTAVTITFSEAMDATTISATNITLKNTGTSAPVAGSVTYNAAAHSATFTPNVCVGEWDGLHGYCQHRRQGCRRECNGEPFTSTFSTAAASDTTPPTVVLPRPPMRKPMSV